MPNKCSIAECKGNYNESNKCRVFRLPKDESERQSWLNVIPPRKDFVINPATFFICERHWPEDPPLVTLPGGRTRPADPPTIFINIPPSCLPTPKPTPRQSKAEDQQLKYFQRKDKICSFTEFSPEKKLQKKYENLITSRSDDKLVCVFMTDDYSESIMSIIVYNKSTLCSPLTLSAFKNGMNVPLTKILNPNNGLAYHQCQ